MTDQQPEPVQPVTDQATFGQNLRRLRLSRNLTQEFLSHRAGVHWTLPGQVERGERNPTLKTILSLARGLDLPPAALFQAGTPHGCKYGYTRKDCATAVPRHPHAECFSAEEP